MIWRYSTVCRVFWRLLTFVEQVLQATSSIETSKRTPIVHSTLITALPACVAKFICLSSSYACNRITEVDEFDCGSMQEAMHVGLHWWAGRAAFYLASRTPINHAWHVLNHSSGGGGNADHFVPPLKLNTTCIYVSVCTQQMLRPTIITNSCMNYLTFCNFRL